MCSYLGGGVHFCFYLVGVFQLLQLLFMMELLYSAHIACGGFVYGKVSLLPNCTCGGEVSCVLVMTSFWGGGTCRGFS